MRPTTRRQFAEQCASAAAGAILLPAFAHAASTGPSIHFPTDPRKRVAVAAYPFREFIVGWKGWDGNTPSKVPREQQMELKDFAAHVAEKFKVHHIEPWSPIFPSTDLKYLEQFRVAVEKAKSTVVDIAVDGGHSQYAADGSVRAQRPALRIQWAVETDRVRWTLSHGQYDRSARADNSHGR